MTHRRSAFAAATTLVAATAVAFLVLGRDPGAASFAQLVDEIAHTKSVQYLETRSTIPRGDEPRGPTVVTKVMVLGRSLERQEVISATEGDPLPEGHSWGRVPLGVAINDWANGRLVWLNTERKVYSLAKTILSMSIDDGTISESEVRPAPEADFYNRIREFPADKAERLPERELAGKRVVGLRTIEKNSRVRGVDTWTRTYWIDVKTNLPVEIETTVESTDPRHGQSRWILSDIVFDEPLDESLFSTDPPDGYTVRSE